MLHMVAMQPWFGYAKSQAERYNRKGGITQTLWQRTAILSLGFTIQKPRRYMPSGLLYTENLFGFCNRRKCFFYYVFNGETEVGEQHACGCGCAKTRHTNRFAVVACVFVPAVRASRLNANSRLNGSGDNAVFIFCALLFKFFKARHGHNARFHAFFCQSRFCFPPRQR